MCSKREVSIGRKTGQISILLAAAVAIGILIHSAKCSDLGTDLNLSVSISVGGTIIESQPDGLLVSISETNYAIVSPLLQERKWKSVSVNGDSVFVELANQKVLKASYSSLDEKTRSFIAGVKSSFYENLLGLVIGKNGQFPTIGNIGGKYGSGYSLGSGKSGGFSGQYGGSNAGKYNGGANSGNSGGGNIAPSNNNNNNGYDNYNNNGYDNYNNNYPPAGLQVGANTGQYSNNGANGANYGNSDDQYQGNSKQVITYNNLVGSPLNDTLDGDVYYFDVLGSIMNIYSSTVSIYQKDGVSIVYRDKRYFTYKRPYMPNNIQRLFLFGNFAFFVYIDSTPTVLAKSSWMLDSSELDLVIGARNDVSELTKWNDIAADEQSNALAQQAPSDSSDNESDPLLAANLLSVAASVDPDDILKSKKEDSEPLVTGDIQVGTDKADKSDEGTISI